MLRRMVIGIVLCNQVYSYLHDDPQIQFLGSTSSNESQQAVSYLSGCGKETPPWYAGNASNETKKLSVLSIQVGEIFSLRCAGCHYPGSASGASSFSDVMDVKGLSDFIYPGDPSKSHLFSLIGSGAMPKGESKLNSEDIKIIGKWIEAGAEPLREKEPNGRPEIDFISEQEKEKCIFTDLKKMDIVQARRSRYFSLNNLYNAGRYAELNSTRKAIFKLVNSLSKRKNIHRPIAVDSTGTLFRIDLDAIGWTAREWDLVMKANPYGVRSDPPQSKLVTSMTGSSTLPYVRGDWFLFAASQGDLYYDLMGIRGGKQPNRDVEKNIDLAIARDFSLINNLKLNFDSGKAKRWGMQQSNVSQFNRIVDRYESQWGSFWISSDFASNTGKSDIFAHPADFDRAGGEIIFSLKNGLQGFALVNNEGSRLTEGPLNIVSHSENRANQFKVVNAYSCMGCHDEGYKVPKDTLRKHVEDNQADLTRQFGTRAIQTSLNALVLNQEETSQLLDSDKEHYRIALEETDNIMGKDTVFPSVVTFQRALGEREIAAELGLKSIELQNSINSNQELKRLLSTSSNRKLDRDRFNLIFGEAIRALNRGEFIAPVMPRNLVNVNALDAVEQKKLDDAKRKKNAAVAIPVRKNLHTKPALPVPIKSFSPIFPHRYISRAVKGEGTKDIIIDSVGQNADGEISSIRIHFVSNPSYQVNLVRKADSGGKLTFVGSGTVTEKGAKHGESTQYNSTETITLDSLKTEALKSFTHTTESTSVKTSFTMSHYSKGYKDYLSPGVPVLTTSNPKRVTTTSIHTY